MSSWRKLGSIQSAPVKGRENFFIKKQNRYPGRMSPSGFAAASHSEIFTTVNYLIIYEVFYIVSICLKTSLHNSNVCHLIHFFFFSNVPLLPFLLLGFRSPISNFNFENKIKPF